jgi:hypothetical protein
MCALVKVESIKPNLMLYWKINILEVVTPFVNGEVLDYPRTLAKHNDGVRGIFAMPTICNIYLYNIFSLSGAGRPFHPSVPSSIHASSSSRKKKMMEEEEDDDEWRQQQFIQMFTRLLIS